MKNTLASFLLLLLSAAAFAQPAAIDGARFGGASDPVQESQARFTLGLTLDGGLSYRADAALADDIRVIGTIAPEAGDIGKTADIFVVDRVNLQFTMKDQDGNFQTWNGRVPDLVPALESVVLTENLEVDVFTGRLGAGGDHRFFIGYLVDGALRYTPSPLRLNITASGSGSDSAFISLDSAEEDLVQGKLLTFDYQGPALSEEEVSVSVDGRALDAILLDGQISFMLPVDLGGALSFQIEAGDESFTYSATIAPAPVIADPEQYVSGVVEDLLAGWDAGGQGWLTEEYAGLEDSLALLGTLSEDELAELAVLLKQNVEPLLLAGGGLSVQAASVDACTAEMFNFTSTVINTIRSNKVVAIFLVAGVAFAPASPILLGIGIGLLVNSLNNVEAGVDQIWDACVEPLLAELREDFDIQQGRSKLLNLEGLQSFAEDEARTLGVQLTYGFLDTQLRAQFLEAASGIRGVLEQLNGYVGGTLDSLIETIPLTDASIELADAASFSLQSISDANITGSIESASEDSLSLLFAFVESADVPAEGYVDFTFHLVSAALDVDLTVPARLYGSLPELSVSADGAPVPNIAGIAAAESDLLFRTIEVGEGPLTIPLSVSNTGTGGITLDAVTLGGGGFSLSGPATPPLLEPEQSQPYTLSYSPNASGVEITSQGPAGAATLTFGQAGEAELDYQIGVRVLLSFAGSYEITSVESSPEEGCANPDSTFPVAVTAQDGVNSHIASFGGDEILFNWTGSGISASTQLVYEEDEGTVTDNLSVGIDLEGNVSGSSTWTWKGGEDSCSGSTVITGHKL